MEKLLDKIKKNGSKEIPVVKSALGCGSQGNCQRCSK